MPDFAARITRLPGNPAKPEIHRKPVPGPSWG